MQRVQECVPVLRADSRLYCCAAPTLRFVKVRRGPLAYFMQSCQHVNTTRLCVQ